MAIKRRFFYSFHYKPDHWRAATVRNIGSIEGNKPADDNDWEDVKKGGDVAIKRWIAGQIKGRSCTVMLVGKNTAARKWINHEIIKSWDDGMGVVGIYIHGLKNSESKVSAKGKNPFDFFGYGNTGRELSSIVKCYDPTGSNSQARYDWIKKHLDNAVENVPPLPEQKAIAHILGSLDNKIELNRRMNETLETMAQALFKSWFVDFDPVIDNALAAGNPIPYELKEKVAIRRGLGDKRKSLPDDIRRLFPSEFAYTEEMGWIPKGWKVSKVGQEVEITGGGTPNKKDESFWSEGANAFCTTKDMSISPSTILRKTQFQLTDKGVSKVSSGQLPPGTVLISSRAPIGYLVITNIPVTINQGIIAMLKQDKFSGLFLLCWAKCSMNAILSRANGSTFLEINKKNFRTISFLVPSKDILTTFNNLTNEFIVRITSCSKETQSLRFFRDSLLSKLLAGEIRTQKTEKPLAKLK